eukprot:CCRYP_017858-RA/>CCRYP_017858-RA protein AED:0.04 eAED:0.04 QI:277/1/1/1/1/0.75/4/1480/212
MKFTSFSTYALLVAFSPNASSFVPSAARPPARSSTSPLSFSDVVHVTAAARPSSELNLFGSRWRKTRQINSQSKAGKAPITESEVRGLFELWNSALATGDSRIVASRYTKSPVLLPTVSDQPRMNYDSVKDYFDTFLLKKPQGTTSSLVSFFLFRACVTYFRRLYCSDVLVKGKLLMGRLTLVMAGRRTQESMSLPLAQPEKRSRPAILITT